MPALDVYRVTDKLDEKTSNVLVERLGALQKWAVTKSPRPGTGHGESLLIFAGLDYQSGHLEADPAVGCSKRLQRLLGAIE
jgi:hypothetical protein